jgi:hypothetical protein
MSENGERVYVDHAFAEGDWGKWTGGGHMQADTPEALHAFAAKLGLKRAWFQSRPGRPDRDHYDLVARRRDKAILLGAIPETLEEGTARRKAARDGGPRNGETIKALPLWQPWASLVAMGAKRVETRAYPPRRLGLGAGQRIAIHATKTPKELWICGMAHFCDHIADPASLPLGALVAVCVLDRASQITETSAHDLLAHSPVEYAFGDYTPGRWAWVLRDVEPLEKPVPFIGSQGAFDVPAELVGVTSTGPMQGSLL